MVGYYDYVLALIPLTLLGTAGLLVGAGWNPVAAVPVAATASLLLIGHALFLNGPVAPGGAAPGTGGESAGSTDVGPASAD